MSISDNVARVEQDVLTLSADMPITMTTSISSRAKDKIISLLCVMKISNFRNKKNPDIYILNIINSKTVRGQKKYRLLGRLGGIKTPSSEMLE